jgi:endonuclease-3 related protein
MGAVLTQNTAWTNAAAALTRLREAEVRLPADVLALPQRRLAGLVRSSGYFNQKAKKLKAIAALFSLPGALTPAAVPSRETLLSHWGIGPETADSILLYAFHVPVFVVDAYTRRILSRIGLIGGRESYDDIQAVFHESMEQKTALFNEYHALIVQHAKRHCRLRPDCASCPVKPCRYRDRGGREARPVRAPRA